MRIPASIAIRLAGAFSVTAVALALAWTACLLRDSPTPHEASLPGRVPSGWCSIQLRDVTGETRIEVGVAYKDGVFSPTATTLINGSTTDASYYMRLTVGVGQRHSGVAGTGVVVDGGLIATGSLFQVRDASLRMEWLEIRNYPGDTALGVAIHVQEAEAPGTYLTHLLIHDYTDNGRGAINIYDDSTVRNTIIYNGPNGIRTFGNDSPQVTIENVTIYGMTADGVRGQAVGTLFIKNTISVGGTQDFDIGLILLGAHVASEDRSRRVCLAANRDRGTIGWRLPLGARDGWIGARHSNHGRTQRARMNQPRGPAP